MGPFKTPWSTFFAWVVTAVSIIIAITWAFIDLQLSKRKANKRENKKE